MNLNKVIIVGRVTQDLELKTTQAGSSVANFSVATNYVYKNQNGEKIENTEFHNVVSFGKQAETIVQYFVKGQEILVEGRLQTKNWEDKESGKKMYKTEIVLEKFEFGVAPEKAKTNVKSAESIGNKGQNDEVNYPEESVNPEDIPF